MTNIELETMHHINSACKAFVNNRIDWEQRKFDLAAQLFVKEYNISHEPSYDAKRCIEAANGFIKA